MRQRPVEHVGDDLHVGMAVRCEAAAGGYLVLVDDTQVAESHEARIVVVAERETVPAVQPVDPDLAALGGFADLVHARPPVPLCEWWEDRAGRDGIQSTDRVTYYNDTCYSF